MAYLVLARKFRPQSFAEVTGQEHVTRTLGNAITRGKIAHAYLLTGPRGVGKTSIARIFSKCLNCEKGPTGAPCGTCVNCISITKGTNLAVREIDGASHNSVDEVRDLIEHFRALPPPGSHYKVYIIDEVHMLSISAFNALLKSLEEPPPHTVFILATTEAHKIPDTVISRCQRHDLRALTMEQVETRLKEIAGLESLSVEPEVFRSIARLSEGSMRDGQSLLDRVHSFCEGEITALEAGKVLGTVARNVLFSISEAVFARKPQDAMKELDSVFSYGVDPALFLKELVSHWRELLLGKIGGARELESLGVLESERDLIIAQTANVDLSDLQDLVYLIREGADEALRSNFPVYALESLLIRLATREPVRALGALFAESAQGGGGRIREEERVGNASNTVTRDEPRIIRTSPKKDIPTAVAPSSGASSHIQGTLHWEEFVERARPELGGILVEQVKRLQVERFTTGILIAKGPEFSIKYLSERTKLDKLKGVLATFSGVPVWDVTLTIVTEANTTDAPPGSILHIERKQKEVARETKANDVANHPSIRVLQKVFPGSTIETIKTREE